MKRTISSFVFLTLLLNVCSLTSKAQTTSDGADLIARATRIHKDVITLDTHNDINVANFTEAVNYTQDLPTQVNIPKMRKGGLDVSWMIVYTGQGPLTDEGYAAAYKNAIDKFEAIHRLTEKIAPNESRSRSHRKMFAA